MNRRARFVKSLLLALCTAALATWGALAFDDARPPIARLVDALCEANAQTAAKDVVLTHLAGVTKKWRLPAARSRVRRALDEPWSGQALATELRDALGAAVAKAKEPQLATLLATVADWTDADATKGDDDDLDAKLAALEAELDAAWKVVVDPQVVELALLTRLSALLDVAQRGVELALHDLEPDERARWFAANANALATWKRFNEPKAEIAEAEQQDLSQVLTLHARVEPRALFATARVLARLSEPAVLDGLASRLSRTKRVPGSGAKVGASGDVLAVVGSTDANRVLLGGPTKTTHGGNVGLSIDVGGDDVYERAAVVDDASVLVRVVLDLGGNDRYAQCAASVAGIALLVDRAGNDAYTSTRFAQAASSGGIAILADFVGNDTYVAEDYAQGFGFQGVGLLLDGDGNDTHTAHAFAQGSTLGNGFGALIDGKGDDTYLADLAWPDSYGDSGPNVYHGASQGSAIGIRPATPGGIAALFDGAGKDRYQAGNFSQGGAYYFSFALMFDGGGDDENFGTRYSQGYGVHQAVGVRWDAGGNDAYHTRCAANLGASWDEGIGWFLEDAGNDVYDEQGGISVGGASNSSLAVFIDGGGDDTYRSGTGADTQGGNGDSSYYGEPSLGVFVDLGGGKDSYSRAGRQDGARVVDAGVGVFVDAKAKTIEEAIEKP